MKISIIINVVLAVAVGILVAKLFFSGNKNASSQEASNEAAIENIMTRTSIRAYSDKDVEKNKVETMLRAAMAAPSAMNKQPWNFVVVDEPAKLKELADSLPYAKMLSQAKLAIVVCGNMQKAIEGNGRNFWIQDASAASENLLLAAHALGLGAVWTGVYPTERVEPVSTVLNLPSHIVPLNVIPIGYPAEDPQPKDKWNPDNVVYNEWK